jgi:hypothetical protein
MRISRLAAATALALSVTPALAQVQQVTPYYKVVERGRSIKLDSFGAFNPDCTQIGRTVINLTSAPQGGQVETGYGPDFPRYNYSNARFQCSKHKLPEAQLFYKASTTFTGTDTFNVEVVFGDGSARQLKYTVYVR